MTYPEHPLLHLLTRISLMGQIIVGLVAGLLLASFFPAIVLKVGFIGKALVSALKAVVSILVFVLVMTSIANHRRGQQTRIRPILLLYLVGAFSAAVMAAIASFAFPSSLVLASHPDEMSPPGGIAEILRSLLLSMMDNPVSALVSANFVGILAWVIGLGITLRHASDTTHNLLSELSSGVSLIVRVVIRFTPLDISGLVASAFTESGVKALRGYVHLLMVLLGCMLFVAFVVNPLTMFLKACRNPYPLVLTCSREGSMTALFTRSSVANTLVSLQLCEHLGLHEDAYSVSTPLDATINMASAAIIITVLTLAAMHILSVAVDVPTAVLLSMMASVYACGTSGVAGGSLLLVPLTCSLLGTSSEVVMQVVAVGFIIATLQDSAETALSSSTDVLFTVAVCLAEERKANTARFDPWIMEETALGQFPRFAPARFNLRAVLRPNGRPSFPSRCMSSPSLPSASLHVSTLHLPAGSWSTVLDYLCVRFSAIDHGTWLACMQRGRVLDVEGRALGPQAAHREGLRVHYFRRLPAKVSIPFEARILYHDEHLLVVDEPHFLPVMPAGGYVEQTLLVWLARSTGDRDLVPLHRIDQYTAGLVLFSINPGSRGCYQALFREQRINKYYEAIAPALSRLDFPLLRRTRLVPDKLFFYMREGEGEPNNEAHIKVAECNGRWWRYRLYSVTGREHQLHMHLVALGASTQNDGFYPEPLDVEDSPDDYRRPSKLLVRELHFDDPPSGERRTFESGL